MLMLATLCYLTPFLIQVIFDRLKIAVKATPNARGSVFDTMAIVKK